MQLNPDSSLPSNESIVEQLQNSLKRVLETITHQPFTPDDIPLVIEALVQSDIDLNKLTNYIDYIIEHNDKALGRNGTLLDLLASTLMYYVVSYFKLQEYSNHKTSPDFVQRAGLHANLVVNLYYFAESGLGDIPMDIANRVSLNVDVHKSIAKRMFYNGEAVITDAEWESYIKEKLFLETFYINAVLGGKIELQ